MKENLSLKDIKNYCDTKLKVLHCGEIHTVYGYDIGYATHQLIIDSDNPLLEDDYEHVKVTDVTPLLRPMSDIDKTFNLPNVNEGEDFNIKDWLDIEYIDGEYVCRLHCGDEHVYFASLNEFGYHLDILNALHFDYQNLIPRGLAANYNDYIK